eukprot:3379553-Pyramimonas_sp.AAC.1
MPQDALKASVSSVSSRLLKASVSSSINESTTGGEDGITPTHRAPESIAAGSHFQTRRTSHSESQPGSRPGSRAQMAAGEGNLPGPERGGVFRGGGTGRKDE